MDYSKQARLLGRAEYKHSLCHHNIVFHRHGYDDPSSHWFVSIFYFGWKSQKIYQWGFWNCHAFDYDNCHNMGLLQLLQIGPKPSPYFFARWSLITHLFASIFHLLFVELYFCHKWAWFGNFCRITHFEGKLLVIQIKKKILSSITPSLLSFWFQLIQVLLQTPMIIDGLRRCSDLEENQTRKPGKPWVTFLIIANLIMYLWETLEVKNPDVYKEQKQYYGYEFWIIISHVTLPLCIFYRFHSAAALSDIWSSAYISGSHW